MKHRTLRRYFRHGTLPQLAVFDAVARHASFTRAAEELHLAQPTVSIPARAAVRPVRKAGRSRPSACAGSRLTGKVAPRHPDRSFDQGMRIVDPVVLRDSRSRCACAASFSG